MPEVLVLNRQRRHAVPLKRLRQFALELAGCSRAAAVDFSVLLTSDRTIRRYNCVFRGKDEPTDVLSFPAQDLLPGGVDKPYLGDMMISVETAFRQALKHNHSLEREIFTLMIHGWLHLLGFDHESDQGQMRRKEIRLQRELL